MKLIHVIISAMGLIAIATVIVLANSTKDNEAKDGVLNVISEAPSSFDPITSNKIHEMTILSMIHESLITVDPNTYELEPALASSWWASKDSTTWTFRLRNAATPEGVSISSEDVVFTVNLYARPDFKSPRKPNLTVGGQLLQVTALDDSTVVFKSQNPAPHLLWKIEGLIILPRAQYEGNTASLEMWQAPLGPTAKPAILRGFGPYYLSKRTPGKIVLKANPNFWGAAPDGAKLPNTKTVNLLLIKDPSIAAKRFRTDSRIPARVLTPVERIVYENAPGFDIVELGMDGSTMFFWVNQSEKAHDVDPEKIRIFRDLNFRKALAHAIDRRPVIERVFLGHANELYGPISRAFSWANPKGIQLEHYTPTQAQPDSAHLLLSSIEGVSWDQKANKFNYVNSKGRSVPLGFTIYTTPSGGDVRRTAAEIIAKQLTRIGLEVIAQVEPFNTVVKRIDQTYDYESCLMFLESSNHPSSMLGIFNSQEGMHFFNSRTAAPRPWERAVDSLYENYLYSGDNGQLAEVLRIWTENQPVIYLATQEKALVVRDGWIIEGYGQSGRSSHPLLERPLIENLIVQKAK